MLTQALSSIQALLTLPSLNQISDQFILIDCLDYVVAGFCGRGLVGFHGGWVSWVSGGVAVLVVICVVVFG